MTLDGMPAAPLRALSLWRPWTELVVSGVKDVENRRWPTTYRGPLVVHGALTWDRTAHPLAVELAADGYLDDDAWATARELEPRLTDKLAAPTGYLGVVDVTGCHRPETCEAWQDGERAFCSRWAFDGQYHWTLTRAARFPAPIPGPGRQGLWTPPPDVLEAAAAVLATRTEGARS